MARRSARGSKRRAPLGVIRIQPPAAMPQPGAMPPLPRSASSSSESSAAPPEDGADDAPPTVHVHHIHTHHTATARLARSRSASSTASAKSNGGGGSTAIAPPAFLQVLHDANAPVIGVHVDGTVTLWNKKVEAITGFPSAEVVGQPLQEFIVGASRRDAVERSIAHAFQDRESTLEMCIPLRTASGRNAQIVTSVTPLLSEDGTPLGVYGIGQDVTERRIHETHYSNVIMQANAPIIELDKEGNISVWNLKAESLTGFSDVVGEPLLPMVDENFREEVSKQIQQTLTGVAGGDFELPLITSAGHRVEIAVCLTPRVDVTGAVDGIVGIGQDVTERNAKEMEYRKFIDSANAPIFGVDLQGRVVIFNKKAAETSEYLPEEIMGANLLETLISEEFRPTVKTVLQNAFEGVETANVEFPLLTKGGRKVEILLNATPRYDHLGNLCGAIGIGQDITDRIIQEQEYSRLIDTANAALFAIDPSGLVSAWNRKASKITRSQHDEVMGKSFVETFVPDDYKEFVNYVFAKALEGVETSNFEFPLITKAGERVTMLLNVSPQTRENGEVTGVIAVGQDITYRVADNEEYIHLIDTANTPICTVDGDGCVNVWNEKMVKITQFTADEVVGESFVHTVVEESHRAMLTDVMRRAHRGEESANFEVVLTTKTARSVRLLMSATTRYNKHCGIVGVLLIGLEV